MTAQCSYVLALGGRDRWRSLLRLLGTFATMVASTFSTLIITALVVAETLFVFLAPASADASPTVFGTTPISLRTLKAMGIATLVVAKLAVTIPLKLKLLRHVRCARLPCARRLSHAEAPVQHIAFLVLMLLVCSWCVGALMYLDTRLQSTDTDETLELALALLAATVAVALATGAIALSSSLLTVAALSGPISVLWLFARLFSARFLAPALNGIGKLSSLWQLMYICAAAVAVARAVGFVKLTRSLHTYYRARLQAAFFPPRAPPYEQVKLYELTQGPYFLCNATLNDFAPLGM